MHSKQNQFNYKYSNPHETNVAESYLNQAIQMTTIKEFNNVMEEDKEQYYDQATNMKQDFMQPKLNDYDMCDNDITKCNPIQRIIHLLHYYDKFKESNSHVPLYEHISSINNYSVSKFMEDWYHSKTIHFKQENDYTWFKSNHNSNCSSGTCAHAQRYQRIRGRETYNINNDIDHKNIILRDHIDSIHAYIFHQPSSSTHFRNNIRFSEDIKEEEPAYMPSLWLDKPRSVTECNVNQMLCILQNGDLFTRLDKLVNYKQQILSYIQDNKFDGNKLNNIVRKKFISQLVTHCNDKKLAAQLGRLYTSMLKFDLSQFVVTTNNETASLDEEKTECNLQQIIEILQNILDNFHLLANHKQQIIEYIQENKFDGNKLQQTGRKPFINKICEHFNNNKLKAQFGKLYNCFVGKQNIQQNNSKFVTTFEEEKSKPSYYSFGEQYRYTENLRENRLFIKSKYDTLKEELFEYFKNINESNDRNVFLQSIESALNQSDLKETINPLVKSKNIDEHLSERLWVDDFKFDNHLNADNIINMIALEQQNCAFITKAVQTILDDFSYSINCVFSTLLRFRFEQTNANIQKDITNCLKNLNEKNFKALLKDLSDVTKKKDTFTEKEFDNFIGKEFNRIITCKQHCYLFDKMLGDVLQKKHSNDFKAAVNSRSKVHKLHKLYQTIDDHLELLQYDSDELDASDELEYLCESGLHLHTMIGPLCDAGTKWRCLNPGCERNKNSKAYKMYYYKAQTTAYLSGPSSFGKGCGCNSEFIICRRCILLSSTLKQDESKQNKTIKQRADADLKKMEKKDPTGLSCYAFNHDVINAFYDLLKLSKEQYYHYFIDKNSSNCTNLNEDIQRWIDDESMNVYQTNIDVTTQQQEMLKIFQVTFEELELEIKQIEQKIRFEFIQFTKKYLEDTIPLKLQLKEKEYIRKQNNNRCEPFIEKAKAKLEMNSVKQLKAIWYHGMNKHHQINVNDPITMQHILSLICYADNTELCTAFRMTYRRVSTDKSIQDQKKRHSEFANLGKLMYEAFIFYASKNGEITTLYHGMGIPLVFPTLYCSLDAPTSTTTASSVALSFGNSTGVVMKLVSCESSPHIKTLDMGLFSCFDNEEEHLIFETRLHIQDIFIPTEKCFIGAKLMHSLSLYDLLTHGNIVHEKKLLKTNKQTKLCNVLNSIIKGEKVTTSKYANSLISALTIENSKIWLNMTQINDPELTDDLRSMFIKTDDEDGPGTFMSYLKSNCKHEVAIFPVFVTNWKMSEETFDLIKRASRKFKNVTIEGSALTCILSENKHIKFKPSLHQIENAFVIKMTLVDVSPQMPIKIHFNLICEELNNFYTSLHPQTMDLKSNNSFHIMLPPIVGKIQDLKLIEIKMSIMLHNCKDFGIDYETFRAENAIIKSQNM